MKHYTRRLLWQPNLSWKSALLASRLLSGGLGANKPRDILTLDQECYWSHYLWSWRGEKDTLPLLDKESNWVNWPCREAREKGRQRQTDRVTEIERRESERDTERMEERQRRVAQIPIVLQYKRHFSSIYLNDTIVKRTYSVHEVPACEVTHNAHENLNACSHERAGLWRNLVMLFLLSAEITYWQTSETVT